MISVSYTLLRLLENNKDKTKETLLFELENNRKLYGFLFEELTACLTQVKGNLDSEITLAEYEFDLMSELNHCETIEDKLRLIAGSKTSAQSIYSLDRYKSVDRIYCKKETIDLIHSIMLFLDYNPSSGYSPEEYLEKYMKDKKIYIEDMEYNRFNNDVSCNGDDSISIRNPYRKELLDKDKILWDSFGEYFGEEDGPLLPFKKKKKNDYTGTLVYLDSDYTTVITSVRAQDKKYMNISFQNFCMLRNFKYNFKSLDTGAVNKKRYTTCYPTLNGVLYHYLDKTFFEKGMLGDLLKQIETSKYDVLDNICKSLDNDEDAPIYNLDCNISTLDFRKEVIRSILFLLLEKVDCDWEMNKKHCKILNLILQWKGNESTTTLSWRTLLSVEKMERDSLFKVPLLIEMLDLLDVVCGDETLMVSANMGKKLALLLGK